MAFLVVATFCRSCGHWTQTDSTCTCGTFNPTRGTTSSDRRRRDGRNRRDWQRIRAAVIERDHGRCTCCGQPPTEDDPLVVHKEGAGYHHARLDAYQTMLNSCHSRLHAAERIGGASL